MIKSTDDSRNRNRRRSKRHIFVYLFLIEVKKRDFSKIRFLKAVRRVEESSK